MRRSIFFVLLFSLLLPPVYAQNFVDICHQPFTHHERMMRVNEVAASQHFAHGDIPIGCSDFVSVIGQCAEGEVRDIHQSPVFVYIASDGPWSDPAALDAYSFSVQINDWQADSIGDTFARIRDANTFHVQQYFMVGDMSLGLHSISMHGTLSETVGSPDGPQGPFDFTINCQVNVVPALPEE